MEYGLGEVLDEQKEEGDTGERGEIGAKDENQVQARVLDLGRHVLFLGLLEVELGENMQPVRDLDDEEELEEEGHVVVWITIPQSRHVHEVFSHNNVATPEQRHDVKCKQLPRFIKLGMLYFGQVQLFVDFVQQVLLNDGVHHDGDQEIEKHSRDILDTAV